MPDSTGSKTPASSPSEDPIFSVAKVAMAIVILTGVITGIIFRSLDGEEAALIAFCLALAYSIFYMIYEKKHRTDGPKAWVGSIISATSIFVACAGINSSITSVVGGSNTTLAGFVKPWFTPIVAKESLQSSHDSVKIARQANQDMAARAASNIVFPTDSNTTLSDVSGTTMASSTLADSILVAQSIERAEHLLQEGAAEIQVRLPAADGKLRYQTVTASDKTELSDKINFYVRAEKGWYIVTATGSSDHSLTVRTEFARLREAVRKDGKAILARTGVRPTPVIWPPASKEDPHYKVVAVYGLKSEEDARAAQKILERAGITNTTVHIR